MPGECMSYLYAEICLGHGCNYIDKFESQTVGAIHAVMHVREALDGAAFGSASVHFFRYRGR